MPVINTNVSSLQAQQALNVNQRLTNTTMQQLSTGSRINSSKDDAAGLGISQTMTAQVRGLNQAVRNLNDGLNMIQTADGALQETSNMLQRMRELAVQSTNATNSGTQRGYLQTEFAALATQINKIANDTTWNGVQLLQTGVSFAFQAGMNSGQTITISVASGLLASNLAIDSTSNSIGTATSASTSIAVLDTAIGTVARTRAGFGAGMNQMTYAVDSQANVSANVASSRSTIMDTDYAVASSALSKSQIIQQAATAMLAQANSQPASVLTLLK